MKAQNYRKKPVVIQAMLYEGTKSDFDLMRWCEQIEGSRRIDFADGYAHIHTLEGVMSASPGDYIICGVKGELYPCKPDIFEETYEAVK